MIEAEYRTFKQVELDATNTKHLEAIQNGNEFYVEEVWIKGILEKITVLNYSEEYRFVDGTKTDSTGREVPQYKGMPSQVAQTYAYFWIDKGDHYEFKLAEVDNIRIPSGAMREHIKLSHAH